MIISIASGKGGTGKTTIAVNLALSLPKETVQLIDCDVEEPNSHIFLSPSIHQVTSVGISVPRIDESKCTYCGKCAQVCEYHAIAVILKNMSWFLTNSVTAAVPVLIYVLKRPFLKWRGKSASFRKVAQMESLLSMEF